MRYQILWPLGVFRALTKKSKWLDREWNIHGRIKPLTNNPRLMNTNGYFIGNRWKKK